MQKSRETLMNQGPANKTKKRETGFEPAAPTLARWCSTPEPLAHKCYHYIFKVGVTGFEPATSWSQTRRSSQAEPHPVITVYINISQMILNFKYFYVPSKPHIEFRLFHKPFSLNLLDKPSTD